MNLSKRLYAVSEMVTEGSTIADIGTDHGYIPIYLALNERISSAFAMDVNEGPLMRALDNIKKYGVERTVRTRLSDGLCGLKTGEADSIIIAGMGGILIKRILSDGLEKAKNARELILSPHSDVELVRRYLFEEGFAIKRESLVYEDEKYYFIIKAECGVCEEDNCDLYFKYGRYLLENHDMILHQFLNHELVKRKDILEKMLTNGSQNHSRIEELNNDIALIKKGLTFYEGE